jgi:hypothetical protein
MLQRLTSEVAPPLLVRRWREQLLQILINQSVGPPIPMLLQLTIQFGTAAASRLPPPDHQTTILIELTPSWWSQLALP